MNATLAIIGLHVCRSFPVCKPQGAAFTESVSGIAVTPLAAQGGVAAAATGKRARSGQSSGGTYRALEGAEARFMAEPISVIGPSLMPCRAVLDVNIMPAYQMPDLRGKRPADLAGAIPVRRVSHRRQPEFKKRNKAVCWCFDGHGSFHQSYRSRASFCEWFRTGDISRRRKSGSNLRSVRVASFRDSVDRA